VCSVTTWRRTDIYTLEQQEEKVTFMPTNKRCISLFYHGGNLISSIRFVLFGAQGRLCQTSFTRTHFPSLCPVQGPEGTGTLRSHMTSYLRIGNPSSLYKRRIRSFAGRYKKCSSVRRFRANRKKKPHRHDSQVFMYKVHNPCLKIWITAFRAFYLTRRCSRKRSSVIMPC